jgi:membrane-associated phospholipid phosphatase
MTMMLLDGSGQMGFFQHLIRYDHWLFSRINQDWTNSFLDGILPYLRESLLWVPFYLFLLVFAVTNFGTKGWIWSFTLMMTGIISDLISSHLVKHLIFRYRPCQDESIESRVRLLVNYCPQDSSFTSSHACNHMAAALFIFLTLRKTNPWWWLVFPWALSICYSQVYLGFHYPLDIAAGILLGCGIGYGMNAFFQRQLGGLSLKTYHSHD